MIRLNKNLEGPNPTYFLWTGAGHHLAPTRFDVSNCAAIRSHRNYGGVREALFEIAFGDSNRMGVRRVHGLASTHESCDCTACARVSA